MRRLDSNQDSEIQSFTSYLLDDTALRDRGFTEGGTSMTFEHIPRCLSRIRTKARIFRVFCPTARLRGKDGFSRYWLYLREFTHNPLAQGKGLEPLISVLETDVLPIKLSLQKTLEISALLRGF